jgi:lysozyme family protein
MNTTEAIRRRAFRFTIRQECRPGPKVGEFRAADNLLDNGLARDKLACVNNPADKGKATAYGITQGTYDEYRVSHGLATRSVFDADAAEILDIYDARYWKYLPAYCTERLAVAVFDTAVLHGKTYAAKRLQVALGLEADGVVGPKTIAAVSGLDAEVKALRPFLQARDDQYEAIVAHDGSQVVFYAGWEKRCDMLCDEVGVPRTLDPGKAA